MTIWNNINSSRSSITIALVLVLIAGLSGCDNLLGDEEEESSDGVSGTLPANTEVTDAGGNTYSVGYDQVSGNDQDPYVRKLDSSDTEVWRIRHDQTPVDARAALVALDDEDRPYVAFTTDGGSNDSDRFQRNHVMDGAFADAPFNSYGSGGGAKVTVIARLDPDTGRIKRGTFLIARLTNGNTNTITPSGLEVSGDTVQIQVDSRFWAPAAGATQGNWSRIEDSSKFDGVPLRYTVPLDLTEITAVQSVSD